MKKNNKKGFTLAELLIVVAIIAVLVAISIPVFTAQLEKAREATDAANIRSAYAEIVVKAIDDPTTSSTKNISLRQQQTGWQTSGITAGLEAAFGGASHCTSLNAVGKGGHAAIAWVAGSTSSQEGHAQLTIS